MHRLVALIVLTAAFAPAAVVGALPVVVSAVFVLLTCWFLLDARTRTMQPVVEPPVTATQ